MFNVPNLCTTALLGASLLLASFPCQARESSVLRAADIHDASYPTVRGLQFIADEIDRTTGGRIRLKIYPGAQLGDERDMLEMTIFGGIDVSRTSIAPLNSIVPETGVFLAALPVPLHRAHAPCARRPDRR